MLKYAFFGKCEKFVEKYINQGKTLKFTMKCEKNYEFIRNFK